MGTYSQQTWHDDPATDTPVSAARLGHMESGIGAAYTSPRPVFIQVVTNSAPAVIKDGADASGTSNVWLCDGTNDEVQINAAIAAAFNSAGGGEGTVLLNGVFVIQAPIVLKTGISLAGTGQGGTILRASGNNGLGMITLFDSNTHLTTVRDMTLDGNFAAGGTCSGIYYVNSSGGVDGNMSLDEPHNSPDASHRIMDLLIQSFTTGSRDGIFLGDNCRETFVRGVRIAQASGAGIHCSGSSDGKFLQVVAITCGTGYNLAGASNQLVQCKASFSTGDGFLCTSSRSFLVGCHAQDNGANGYNVTGGTPTLVGCVADSNMRLDQTKAGYNLNVAGCYEGLDAYDRGQTPGSPQSKGIILGASIGASMVTGKVSVTSGGTPVTATGTPQYARIVRVGSTLYSAG